MFKNIVFIYLIAFEVNVNAKLLLPSSDQNWGKNYFKDGFEYIT